MPAPIRVRFDVLRTALGERLLDSSFFPIALQAGALVAVLALAWLGWGVGQDRRPDELLVLRKTSLITLIVWGLWWPGMIALALVAGRVWCTVCPLELVARGGEAVSRWCGLQPARLGRLLRGGWLAVGAYLSLQAAVAGFSIHRVPHATALTLLVLVGGAWLVGLVFRDARALCRAFCPAAPLLSVYGRVSPVRLDVRDDAVCAACATRDCVREARRNRLDGRSCPSRLAVFARRASDGCVLCLQCAKACPNRNVGLGVVAVDAPQRRPSLLQPAEVAFVVIAFGFVSHEVMGEVPWLEDRFHAVPAALAAALPALTVRWWEALWFLGLFPALAWGAVVVGAWLVERRSRPADVLLRVATAVAPIVALAHLAKAAAKGTAWLSYLPLALHNPVGLETAGRLSSKVLAAPAALADLSTEGWAMLALLGVAVWRFGRFVPGEDRHVAWSRVGLVLASVWFAGTFVAWGLS